MFSSCLESIEPEGLNDLRGAKADLLRAQTALVEAQAAQANAQAAIAQAEAKIKEAIAKQEEAKVAIIEAEALLAQYQAEYQALVNAAYEAEKAFELEQAIAAAEAAKAEAERLAELAAAQLELDLLETQTLIVEAKAAYEVALKNLALAKNGLTPEQKAYVESYQNAVDTWQGKVDQLSVDLSTYAIALKTAIATLDEKQASAQALRSYEVNVIKAEAKVKGAEAAVEILESVMELDPQATDWAAEVEDLKAAQDAKQLEWDMAKAERDAATAAYQEALDELTEAYQEYEDATGYAFNTWTGVFDDSWSWGTNALPYPDFNIPSPKNEDGDNLFYHSYYGPYADFIINGNEVVGKDSETGEPILAAGAYPYFYYDDPSDVIEAFDYEIEKYEAITVDSYEAQIAGNLASIKTVQESYEEGMADYEAAVAAYKAGDPVAYFKAVAEAAGNEYDIETPVADYNAALKAMVAALDTYNAELKKYEAADNSEAEDAAEKAYIDAKAAALATYMGKRQKALDDYNKARVAFEKAYLTFQRADRAYNAVLAAAVETVGALENNPVSTTRANVAADLTAAIKAYDDAKTAAAGDPTFDADKKWAKDVEIYTAELKKVNDAQKLYDDKADATNKTDAVDVWAAAKEAYAKAGGNPEDINAVDYYETNTAGDYYKAVDGAKKEYYAVAGDGTYVYEGVTGTAWQKYQDTIADLGVGATGMDTEYEAYLWKNYTDAVDALVTAIGKIKADAIIKAEDVEVVMGDEEYISFKYVDEYGTLVDPEFPDYLVDAETQALKGIKVADIVDKEYFLATTVKGMADALSETAYVRNVLYEDPDTGYLNNYYYEVIGAPEDYPLSLPTYESFIKAIEPFEGDSMWEKAYAYAVEAYRVFANKITADGYYVDRSQTGEGRAYGTYSTYIFNYTYANEKLAESIANVPVAEEHVKVLEAAKAEFEAFAEAEVARIDALRTKVEDEWNDVYMQNKAITDAQTAHTDEMNEIASAITDLETLIGTYVKVQVPVWNPRTETYDIQDKTPTNADIEQFVADLEKAYNEAVIKVGDFEAALEDAKTAFEKAKAGEWTYNGDSTTAEVAAVKLAEADYEKCAAELDYAMTRLEAAAQALQDALIAIGAVEPEETPAE